MIHDVVQGPKGDKRGAPFGRARINLAKYAGASVGKRLVLTLKGEGAAEGGRPLTAVVTVAAEPTDRETDGSEALDEVAAAAAAADRALAGARAWLSEPECILEQMHARCC